MRSDGGGPLKVNVSVAVSFVSWVGSPEAGGLKGATMLGGYSLSQELISSISLRESVYVYWIQRRYTQPARVCAQFSVPSLPREDVSSTSVLGRLGDACKTPLGAWAMHASIETSDLGWTVPLSRATPSTPPMAREAWRTRHVALG